MVLWAFASMRKPCSDLLEAASKPLVQNRDRLANMSPALLPTLLWAVARLLEACGGNSRSSGGTYSQKEDSADPLTSPGGRRHEGLVLGGVMPFELMRLAAEGPLSRSERVKAMTPRGVVTCVWSFATCGVQLGEWEMG